MTRVLALLFTIMCAASASAQPLPAGTDPQNTLVLDTTQGRIVIKLRNDIAPQHAERLKQLARDHFYDNVPFHRVPKCFGPKILSMEWALLARPQSDLVSCCSSVAREENHEPRLPRL